MWRWARTASAALASAVLCAPTMTVAAGVGAGSSPRDGVGALWFRSEAAGPGAAYRVRLPAGSAATVLEHRRTSSRYASRQESYMTLKGGGLRVGEDPATDGLFLGFEAGTSLEKVFEVGFSIDYYYQSTENVLVLDESDFTHLPLQMVALDRAAAHLVPLGLTLRLRLPFGVLSPFVSTTLAYEMLFLDNVGGSGDPWLEALAEDETFTGFGCQAAAGLGIRLSPAVGLFGEAGYHWGAPGQGYLLGGVPVDVRVNMDGPFLRGGLRFGL